MKNDTADRVRNRLLSRLQPQNLERLMPYLKVVALGMRDIVYEARSHVDYLYFPYDCVLSAVTVMEDGSAIEVGSIGNEGAAGLTAFLGPGISPHRVLAQVPGQSARIEVEIVEQETRRNPAFSELMMAHHYAFLTQISQSVACNGLHPLIKRCCRWLLLTHDRVDGDELPLTHEFLSYMLGVRRPGVTESLKTLQTQGLIENERGVIRIINRAGMEAASCECYRVVRDEYQRLLGMA